MPDIKNSQKPHELDTILVANPDVNCDHIDPEEGYSHKDYFQVRWEKQPHRIPPGRTKRMPRFLAEHFAKHLADHMLIMKEEKTGRKGLMTSPTERPKILKEILVEVEEHFLGEADITAGEKVTQMVKGLNPTDFAIPSKQLEKDEPALDLGMVPNPVVGTLKPEPKPMEDIMKEVAKSEPKELKEEKPKETSIYDDSKPRPTRKELFAEAAKLEIEVTGRETVDELINKIKKF